jgi:uncharacterized phage protein gp47/JayE
MPWVTPTLLTVRSMVRDSIRGQLPGADASIPNSVLRVISDVQGGLCHLTLQFIDWLALQLMPDTAEREWLDRHGNIWLTNADGTTGRKMATLASGTVNFESDLDGAVIPQGTQLTSTMDIGYETMQEATTSASTPVPVPVRALDPGSAGNLPAGTALSVTTVASVATSATVVTLDGGTDEETDDALRMRVLERIRNPPMGGDAEDYVNWGLRVPGVTRAWSSPLEMGMGTVTLRFMMDELRADNDGFPGPSDLRAVEAYLRTVRPVAVKDFFVVAPIRQRVDFIIQNLIVDTPATRAAIQASAEQMLFDRAKPGQTIYSSWKAAAVLQAAGVDSFRLFNCDTDDVMLSAGHMAVLGDVIFYGGK